MQEPHSAPGLEAPPPESRLPGWELVAPGLADLARHVESEPALLVASFSSRLRALGFHVPDRQIADPEIRLYRLIEATRPNAHAHYNALVRRMVSFAEAAECVR